VLGSESCPACGCPFFRNMDLSLELHIIVQLNMLIESVRHKTIPTRRLAVCYLHALAVMDPLMCNMLLELHVMSALETLLAQVSAKKRIDAEWLTLEDPIREALQALPPTTLWLSIPSSKTEQSHRGLAEVMVLIKLSRYVHNNHLRARRSLMRPLKTARSAWFGVLASFIIRFPLLERSTRELALDKHSSRSSAPDHLLPHYTR
jgi:hypothetical protein